MAIATYEQLRASVGPLTESRAKLAKSLGSKDLFLSHSQLDSRHVGRAIGLLEKHGGSVYADVDDAAIEDLAPSEIASRLRMAVKTCGRLVVLVTPATASSRWVPWEMGLADGSAGPNQVAILPLRASDTAAEMWAEQEYFDLYGRIEFVELVGDSAPCWAVRNPATHKYRRLEKWMRDTSPRLHK